MQFASTGPGLLSQYTASTKNINEIPPLVISVPVIADVAKYTATLVAAPIAALLAMYPAATTMTGIIRPVGSFTRMGLL